MGPVEVEISMSVDGFITGPNEEGAGLGEGGEILHAWFFRIQTARAWPMTPCSPPRAP